MAKKTKKRTSLTRKQRSRLEREQRIEQILIWGVVAVAILVVGVLTYGFIVENVVKARKPVAKVGEEPITVADFQARVRFARMQMNSELQYLYQQQQAIQDPTDPDVQYYLQYLQNNIRELQGQLSAANAPVVGEEALEQLIEEELIRQEAARRGIEVTPVEIDQAVEEFFGYDASPATPTPLPTPALPMTQTDVMEPTGTPFPTPVPMTAEEFKRQRSQFLKAIGASEQQFRTWIEAFLLSQKLREHMQAETATTAEQVKLHYLTVNSQDKAEELAVRLDAGEDFESLGEELQEQEEEGVQGYTYEWEWLPREVLEDRLGPTLTDLAFSLEVGEHSGPVQEEENETWYTIIKVVGREERALEESVREQLGNEAFLAWLENQRAQYVERDEAFLDYIPTPESGVP